MRYNKKWLYPEGAERELRQYLENMKEDDNDEMLFFISNIVGLKTKEWNTKQFEKMDLDIKGISEIELEMKRRDIVEAWIERNKSVINSKKSDIQAIRDIAKFENWTKKEIKEQIKKTINSTVTADKEIGVLNSELTKLNQTAAGIKKYIWRTMGDEKVRPSHRMREGGIFSWNSAPAGGHPGEDYGCRCWAEPYKDDK